MFGIWPFMCYFCMKYNIMKNDLELKFERQLNEAVSNWLKNIENYPEKDKLNLKFIDNSQPKFIDNSQPNNNEQFPYENLFKIGKVKITVKFNASYWFIFKPEAKMNGLNYNWTINNLIVFWNKNDFIFDFKNVDVFSYLLMR